MTQRYFNVSHIYSFCCSHVARSWGALLLYSP